VADALVDRYPQVLTDAAVSRSALEHGAHPALPTAAVSLSAGTRGSSLDLMTVVKSAQALAGEVQLGALLEKLLLIVLENAGAQRGALLLRQGDELRVQAEGRADGTVEVLQDAPLAEHGGLAHAIVNYVARANESVVLHDATAVNRFSADPYLARARPRSILCIPLVNQGRLTGVLYLENNLAAGAFTADRSQLLGLLAGQIAIALDNALLYEQLEERVRQRTEQLEARNTLIRQTFGRYLSDEIVNSLLERPAGSHLGGDKRKVTIMMADLRGFTTMAESLPPEQVVAVINNFLAVMTDVVFRHEGTIDEIMGDAILAIFGAPFLHEDDARRAVACATEMQSAMADVNERNRAAGLPELQLAIGINTGEAVVGSIGSERRAKYGAVGRNINLAARIESFAVGGQILVSEATLRELGDDVVVGDRHVVELKGVLEPVPLYDVTGVGGSADRPAVPLAAQLAVLPRPLPVRYAIIDGKRIADVAAAGLIMALSRDEAEIRGAPPAPLTNVRLELSDGDRPVHVYGKVITSNDGAEPRFVVRFTAVPDTGRSLLEASAAAPPVPAH
jgi:class 3 adenylate cyclase